MCEFTKKRPRRKRIEVLHRRMREDILSGSIPRRAAMMRHVKSCPSCMLELGRVIDSILEVFSIEDRRAMSEIIIARLDAAERMDDLMSKTAVRLHSIRSEADLPN